jgi:hypothetical protein
MVTLTDSQYTALLALFNECNEDFWLISRESQVAFFNRLYGVAARQLRILQSQALSKSNQRSTTERNFHA